MSLYAGGGNSGRFGGTAGALQFMPNQKGIAHQQSLLTGSATRHACGVFNEPHADVPATLLEVICRFGQS